MEFAIFRRKMALTEGFQKTTAGLEGPREVAFGLLTPEVQHGGFGPVHHISDQLKVRRHWAEGRTRGHP